MYIVLTLPFVDLRTFSDRGRAFRLLKPTWPTPLEGYDFVRKFGVVRRLPGGGLMPWVGEEFFCDASRAVVFDKPLRDMAKDLRLLHVSRRLFTTGIVGRVQLEFQTPYSDDHHLVATTIGELKVRVGKAAPQNLIRAAPRVAEEYSGATQPVALRNSAVRRAERLVMPGLPMVALEFGASSAVKRGRPQAAELAMDSRWSNLGQSSTALWTISHQNSVSAEDVRRARRHAVRLHCEIEAFSAVMRACRTGLLDVSESQELTDYLYKSAQRLLKNTFDGFPHFEVLRAIAASRQDEREGELASLEETFRSINSGAKRMLKDAGELIQGVGAPAPTSIINFTVNYDVKGSIKVNQDNSIRVGEGAHVRGIIGNNNKISDSSFGDSSPKEMQGLVSLMIEQLRELAPQLTNNELLLAELVEEQMSQDPPSTASARPLLDRILSGIQKMGEAGAPVADTVQKILEIIGG